MSLPRQMRFGETRKPDKDKNGFAGLLRHSTKRADHDATSGLEKVVTIVGLGVNARQSGL